MTKKQKSRYGIVHSKQIVDNENGKVEALVVESDLAILIVDLLNRHDQEKKSEKKADRNDENRA